MQGVRERGRRSSFSASGAAGQDHDTPQPALDIDGRTYPGWLGRDNENPLQGLQYNFSNSRGLSTNGDLNLDYNITKHLSFATYNRITLYNDKYVSYYDARTKSVIW